MFPPASRRLTFAWHRRNRRHRGGRRWRAVSEPTSATHHRAAEFLVTAGDSAFWVSTSDGRFRIRRAPLTVANVAGRFYELYVADDDRSYFDALLIGQRIYRRDLVSGDSLQVFEDVHVNRIARAYAAAHPTERPLDPDEEGSDDPHTVATSDAELLDVVGPLLSFAHHTDIDIANTEDSHSRSPRRDRSARRDGAVAARACSATPSRAASSPKAERRIASSSIQCAAPTAPVAGARPRAIDSFRFDSTSFTDRRDRWRANGRLLRAGHWRIRRRARAAPAARPRARARMVARHRGHGPTTRRRLAERDLGGPAVRRRRAIRLERRVRDTGRSRFREARVERGTRCRRRRVASIGSIRPASTAPPGVRSPGRSTNRRSTPELLAPSSARRVHRPRVVLASRPCSSARRPRGTPSRLSHRRLDRH